MHSDWHEVTDLRAWLLAQGLRPIAGGKALETDPGTEGTETADDSAGDATDGEPGDEGAGGAEGAEGAAQGDGDEPGAEGAPAPDGEPGEGLDSRPLSRGQRRYQELANANRELRQTIEALDRRLKGLEPRPGSEDALPGEFKELDQHLGGYVGHRLGGVTKLIEAQKQQIAGLQSWIQFFGDQADFYSHHPEYSGGEPRRLVEAMVRLLGQKYGPEGALREDALQYLRGNPKYAKHFVTEAEGADRLAGRVAAARRGAGTTGGRPVVKPGARASEPLDLGAISSPAERVKAIERQFGDEPF